MRLLRGTVLAAIVLAILVGAFLYWAKPAEEPSELLFVGGDIITMADLPVELTLAPTLALLNAVAGEDVFDPAGEREEGTA